LEVFIIKEFLSVKEVAARLRISWQAVTRAVARGDLEAYRVGGQYRITPGQVEAWLERILITNNNMEDKDGIQDAKG
jgi:excisionase family DNA binding protein